MENGYSKELGKDNYCKSIRRYYQFQIDSAKKFLVELFACEFNMEELFYASFVEIINDTTRSDIEKEKFFNKEDTILMILCAIQMYTDMYKKLRYLERMGLIEEIDIELLRKLEKVNSYTELLDILLINPVMFSKTLLNWNDLPVYDKILEIKALTEEDIKKLSSINPVFMAEYNNYNVKVDENFIARQIGKWQKSFKNDIEKSYIDAANFIEKYSLLDSKLKEELKSEYSGEKLCDIVKDFYLVDGKNLNLKP